MILCDKNGDPLGLNPMDGNGFFMYSTEYNPDGEYIYYVNDGKTGIAFSKEEMSNTKLMVNMGKK